MIDINDIKNYKKCYKKQVEMWMAKPEIGTVVVDCFNQATGYSRLLSLRLIKKSEPFILGSKVAAIKANNRAVFSELCNLLSSNEISAVRTDNDVVLCGSLGQMYITTKDYIQRYYKKPSDGGWVNIDFSKLKSNFDWCRVKVISSRRQLLGQHLI